jgi:hypothetical protein
LLKSRCGTAASGDENRRTKARNRKFPVFFPVTREFVLETGSLVTASTTIVPQGFLSF